jgi:enamine deaminase RidA (YjgF/YER057c/UK114 family)
VSVRLHPAPAGLGEPIGLYSAVSVVTGGDIVQVAGQVGITPTGDLGGDGSLAAQLRQVFRNLELALAEVGGTLADITKTTTYVVADKVDVDEFVAIRAELFAELFPAKGYPPNSLLVVDRLLQERFLVEIEAQAAVEGAAGVETRRG